ncbi:hypothetical protein [Pseudomonas helvetica]|uniref:hypothetical protein n=1 Tax=Pseudomonas helvetica TaxID=3136738 RepID=UPI0032666838
MYRRILLSGLFGLSLSACFYYAEPGYYGPEVYTAPAPYYYGGYYYGGYYYRPYYYGGYYYGPRYYGGYRHYYHGDHDHDRGRGRDRHEHD